LPLDLGPSPLDEYLAWNYQYRGTSGVLFLSCAAIALLLASVGLYAVISYSVRQHTRELGVRIAIGASERNILALVFREGVVPLAIGLVVGLTAAFGVNWTLASLLVGVSPADPVTLGATCAVLVVAAALGCWFPARRAARVDPVVALRQG
jgi:ABC-type antimicrobial peptide transport system permease subunit